jgi:DNA-binding SARP family transcriptional activator
MSRARGIAVVAARVRTPRVSGLARERLERLLPKLWDHDLCLVTAPAGAGKSTLLGQFAAAVDAPVAWYRAESSDSSVATLLAYLEAALTSALGPVPGGWQSVEDAAAALESWAGSRALLVIDDLHLLADTPAEAALERFIGYAPPSIAVLAATRSAPRFNLSGLRVSGRLLELGADDLRFRSWEVERLFRDFYAEPLAPETLARLAQRTEGWAAGLQLFHLATQGRRADERKAVLAAMHSRSGPAREYLASNVLGQLAPELREFLLGTCVLGRLSGALCDELLGRDGSAELLAELERRQIFTVRLDPDGSYRYHEVLRAHLEVVVSEQIGEGELRLRYRRAAALLERHGALDEALVAYARADDWPDVARLLGDSGERIAVGSGDWLDLLPAAALRDDPWMLLATARHHRAAGRWRNAVESYRRAEEIAGPHGPGLVAQRERQALNLWLEPVLRVPSDWSGVLRRGVMKDPNRVVDDRRDSTDPRDRVAAGVAALMAGRLEEAGRMLAQSSREPDAGPVLSVATGLAAAVCKLLTGHDRAARLAEHVTEAADTLGVDWLTRAARALAVFGDDPQGREEAVIARERCVLEEDRWGHGLITLMIGLRDLQRTASVRADEVRDLRRAVDWFIQVDAGVLDAWASALLALALVAHGDPDAESVAVAAESRSRSLGVPAARALAHLALASCRPQRQLSHHQTAFDLAADCGFPLLADIVTMPPAAETAAPTAVPLSITCFGGFRIHTAAGDADLSDVRPRARALLRLLAALGGGPVHREVLASALWPSVDAATGTRNVQVAVSSLRRALQGSPVGITRVSDAYRLDVPDDAIDVAAFERAIGAVRRARAAGDAAARQAALEAVLDLHHGELLPEDGPADWVVGPRDRYRSAATEAAQALAELHLAAGDAPAAIVACERGLQLDRFQDGLWQLMIRAYDVLGNQAASQTARRRYTDVLAELGIDADQSLV